MLHFIIFTIILIIKKINSQQDQCSDILDCFNCTLSENCIWKNKTCIYSSKPKNISLFKSNNKTHLFYDMRYLRNICYETKPPYIINDNDIIFEEKEKYCGNRKIILTNEVILKGYRVQLNNVDEKYGISNILCEYIFISGGWRHDVDIYINRSLSKDFLLFYLESGTKGIEVNYSKTISLFTTLLEPVSFLYYSNRTFDTPPFIINFKEYRYEKSDSPVLTYLFLLLILAFIGGIIGSIIYVRKNSIFFDKNMKKYIKININQVKKENFDNDNDNEIKLSAINEELPVQKNNNFKDKK